MEPVSLTVLQVSQILAQMFDQWMVILDANTSVRYTRNTTFDSITCIPIWMFGVLCEAGAWDKVAENVQSDHYSKEPSQIVITIPLETVCAYSAGQSCLCHSVYPGVSGGFTAHHVLSASVHDRACVKSCISS